MKTCIILRNGSEIWIPEDKAKQLSKSLIDGTAPRYVQLTDAGNRIINTADIVEFLTGEQMDDKRRIKNGEWKCDHGAWHNKRQRCDCISIALQKDKDAKEEQRQKELDKKRTPEEQARINKRLKIMRADLGKKLGWAPKKKNYDFQKN